MVKLRKKAKVKKTKDLNAKSTKVRGGLIKCDDLLKKIYRKDYISGLDIAKGAWAYIRKHGLQIKTKK